MIVTQCPMPAQLQYVVQSLAIRVRAIFLIYAKTTAALARVGYHRTLMKISECLIVRRASGAAFGGKADIGWKRFNVRF
jgi:hypothetical protein